MLAAACSAIRSKPVHPNRKPDEATNYLKKVRLGQTEVGNFVVQIISRVSPTLDLETQNDFFPALEVPYERSVTETLARSLQALTIAIQTGGAGGNFKPFNNTVGQGVSANLCEALAGLRDDNQKVSLHLSWAKTRQPQPSQASEFSFDPRSLSVLGEAARTFRANAPREEFPLQGIVVKLAKTPRAQRGEIRVLAVIDGHAKLVSVTLEENEYRQAVQAHKDKRAVLCSGELVKEGRTHRLKYPRGFSVEDGEI